MTPKQYTLLQDEGYGEPIITIDDLKDKSERTLLYGYTTDRTTWHVYLLDGRITLAVYKYNEAPTCIDNDTWVPSTLVPNKRLYPECCDFEFCCLLKSRGVYLPFTTWQDREPKQFYGKT